MIECGRRADDGSGKAEILLTPGIFLRVDSNSAVKMISPDLAQTQVEIDRGRAGCRSGPDLSTEHDPGDRQRRDHAADEARLLRVRCAIILRPWSSKAGPRWRLGDGKWETVKDHHELALVADGAHEKTADFDARPTNDELYNWSSLRSQYLAEANNQIAGEYAV